MNTEAKKALRKFQRRHLSCRELKHAWETVKRTRGATISTGETVMQRVDECLRCGTKKIQTYKTPTMEIVSTDYRDYPDGYRVDGIGRISTFDVRAEAFRRDGFKIN